MPEYDDSADGSSADPFADDSEEENVLEDAVAAATGLKRAVTKMKATSSHIKKRRDNDDDDNNSFSMSKSNLGNEIVASEKYPTTKSSTAEQKVGGEVKKDVATSAKSSVDKYPTTKATETPPPKVEIKVDLVVNDEKPLDSPTTAADALLGQEKRLRRANSSSRPSHELGETERPMGAGELKIKSQITRKNSKNSSPRASLNTEQIPAQDLAKLKGLSVGSSSNGSAAVDPNLQPRKTVKEMAKGIAEPSLEPRKTVKEMTSMWKQGR